MNMSDGTTIAEDLQHSMNCSAWKDMHGHDVEGEDCTCGLRFRIEISTLQTLKAAWEKRAYEAEERVRVLREALRDVVNGKDLAHARQQDMRSWPGSDFRRRAVAALATPAPEQPAQNKEQQ